MIIDVHTNIWSSLDQLGPQVAARLRTQPSQHWGQLDGSPAAHEQETPCVDAAVVIGFRSDLLDACIPNEYVADFVSKDPRRRIGVAGIDPMAEDAMDQLEAAVGYGLSGAAVSPACQGFHPAHSSAMRVYERCMELSIPLFITSTVPLTSSARLEFARPAPWDEVARSFPDLPIVIGQIGHPWVDETLLLLGKHDRVFADISGVVSRPWQLYNALLNALSFGVIDKLLFGSGFPHESPAKAIESVYTINAFGHGSPMPGVPRPQLRGIVERDAIACLGIDAIITPRSGETDASVAVHEGAAAALGAPENGARPTLQAADEAKGDPDG